MYLRHSGTLIILIFMMLIVSNLCGQSKPPLECFRSPFPKVLGSVFGNTDFEAIDVYIPKDDIVASGNTEDLNVKGGCT